MKKNDKVWLNSISGIFVGIMLTFSGFGIGLNPIANFQEGGIMFAILIVYAILGLACGFFSIFFTKKKKDENDCEKVGQSEENKLEDNISGENKSISNDKVDKKTEKTDETLENEVEAQKKDKSEK